MKVIGIILMVIGIIGMFLSFMMFGDIGVAAFIGSLTGLLSGVGFLQVSKSLNQGIKK